MNPPKKKSQKLTIPPKKEGESYFLSPPKNHLRLLTKNKNRQVKSLQPWKTSESTNQPTGPRSVESLTWISFPGSGGLKRRRMGGSCWIFLFAKFGEWVCWHLSDFLFQIWREFVDICRNLGVKVGSELADILFPNYGSFHMVCGFMCSMFLNLGVVSQHVSSFCMNSVARFLYLAVDDEVIPPGLPSQVFL